MKLDNNGLKQLREVIKEKEAKLDEAIAKKGDSLIGDSPKDNGGYESATMQVLAAQNELHRLRKILGDVKLIKPHNDPNKVDIGDIITLHDLNFDDNFNVKLIADYHTPVSNDDELEFASINSPLGEAIFKKSVGEIATYTVDNREFKMKIQNIQKPVMNDNKLPIK